VVNIYTMYPRYLTQNILDALGDTPVVLLNGARQTGKSTLVQWICKYRHPARYVTLDDASVLSAAKADPAGFLAGFSGPLVIDEIQRVPELFLALKAQVDKDRTPGRFLMTGSANVLVLPKLADTLTGRMEILSLWPLSQGEIQSHAETFVDAVFSPECHQSKGATEQRDSLFQVILTGGFPEVIQRTSEARRKAWFNAYITTILQRDIRDLSRIEGLATIPRLLSLLAVRSGHLLNFSEISRTSGLPQATLKRYMALLEATFLIKLLPPWSANLSKRLVKSPKIFVMDTGLLSYLIGMDKNRFIAEPELAGPLLENFVIMELTKQISWSQTRPQMFHFRTQVGGKEVDIVLEDAAGRIVGIEVKAAHTVKAGDLAGLKLLAEETQDRFVRGIVLYTGSQFVPFGNNIMAVPVSTLWKP
jgi:predicted AAA+ superfamily ATPase